MQNHSITLASTSPRRRELITLFDAAFQFASADIDEAPRDHESPEQLVRRLSRAKAELGARDGRDAIVIGADTIGWIDDAIIGKPCDLDDAVRMLKQLRARPHIVYSGVTVKRGERALTLIATTTVWMRDYSDAEIAAYVATGDPLDKAAAYAIQHGDFRPVARIDGCHANVMGLPLCHLYRALRSFGAALTEPDRACQAHLGIVCPVARDILSDQYSVVTEH
ncbi:MAG: septum formation protein Maf [Chloroflexi bacterium]|nr:septum formation protein Maf [Chloroflexota bacterium]